MTEEKWLFAMPESHWLEPSDPHFVNLFIRLQNQTSQRKVRLAAGACARQNRAFMKLFGADCAVDAIDKVADECGTLKDLKQAVSNLGIASNDPEFGPLRKSINISLCSEHSLTSIYDVFSWAFPENATLLDPAFLSILRDIFGNPFRPIVADPAWLTPTVQSIAAAIYQDRAFDRLPILADALEEAGCTNADVLLHCRQPGEHVRGCWVVDLVLWKA